MSIDSLTQPAGFTNRSKEFLTKANFLNWVIVLAVYGITGTLATLLSRFILNGALNMEGSFVTGSWAYRGIYILIIPPLYSLMLIAVGSAFGKHLYFRQRVLKMWSRLLPSKRFTKIVKPARSTSQKRPVL